MHFAVALEQYTNKKCVRPIDCVQLNLSWFKYSKEDFKITWNGRKQ